jgi:hypothetical protein
MTVSLANLADLLPITSVVWDERRNDVLSGTGDSRVWPAELADQLWSAEVTVWPDYIENIKPLVARIRALRGPQESFWLYDPTSMYPVMDPTGSIVGSSNVQIHTIGAGNASLRLKGLPAGYQLKWADKGQATYATSRNFFFEMNADVTADGSGITPEFAIYPNCPIGLAVNDAVNLKKPACKMFIFPGSFHPGTSENIMTSGMKFTAVERRR